jgi:taurine dioxygenase
MDQGFAYPRDRDQSDRLATLNAKEQQAVVARHPVLKRHPGAGRMLVYVDQSFTGQIVGMSRAEADVIPSTLHGMVHRPDFQVRIKWTKDTLVIWDNWATRHYAVTDHFPAEREMHRVTGLSDGRAGAFGGDSLDRAA